MQRVPAAWIAKRAGGWNFPYVDYSEAKRLAIPIMTMQKERPDGHTGIYITDVYGGKVVKMLHAGGHGVKVVLVEPEPKNPYHSKTRVILQVKWK